MLQAACNSTNSILCYFPSGSTSIETLTLSLAKHDTLLHTVHWKTSAIPVQADVQAECLKLSQIHTIHLIHEIFLPKMLHTQYEGYARNVVLRNQIKYYLKSKNLHKRRKWEITFQL